MAGKKRSDPFDKALKLADAMPAWEELSALQRGAEAALSKRLFFICGALKSGTTWLQLMLDGHPRIACRGEGHLLNFLLPELGKALQQYNERIKFKNKAIFNEIEGFPQFGQAQHYALLRTAIGLLFAQYDREQAQLIGEKTPDNVLYLPMLARLLPEARFIHVIRDGRDAAVSGWFHNLRVSEEWANKEFGSFAAFAEHYAEVWAINIRAGRRFGALNPERYCEVRYEDMLADSSRAMDAVLKFLDATREAPEVEKCVQAGNFRHLTKGRTAGTENRESHFRKGVQGDWRQHFDELVHAKFQRHSGGLLEELGYDVPFEDGGEV